MEILITGQTTLHWGRMEFGNIGNYYIIEPFIRELHKNFSSAKIKTTLQMSKEFCERENIEVLPMEIYFDFNSSENLKIAKEELKFIEEFIKTGELKQSTRYIDEVLKSDIVIDFSGDIWGKNADFLGKDRFEVGLYKNYIAQKLNKFTCMLAGSPGPFDETKLKFAKEVYDNFDFITNREPISTKILEELGFNLNNTKTFACPAFLFEPEQKFVFNSFLETEGISKNRKNIGFCICGWNFLNGPFDKWPREDSDYDVFVNVIEDITNKYDVNICLLSHSNGFPIPPKEFELIRGRDYPIIKQLQRILKERGIAKNVFAVDGIYDTWKTKAIIKNFDMMISGRVHAAVAAMSQNVPTVVIDYGHEPKAHKLLGFSTVAGQEKFLSDPGNYDDLIKNIYNCFENIDIVKSDLEKKIPLVKESAKNNFKILKEEYIKKNINY